MAQTNLASIEFSLQWQSSYAVHRDTRFVEKVHFWRDIFPEDLDTHLALLEPDNIYRRDYDAGILVDPFDHKRIRSFSREQFKQDEHGPATPRVGKFYPQGWAWRALHCFPQNIIPFRVIDSHKELFVADTNHPLSRYPLTLEARLIKKWQPAKERGGGCNDIASIVTGDGPGMQIPYQWMGKEGYNPYPFHRKNNDDDSHFYQKPRMVKHLDDTAIDQVRSMYSRLLPLGAKILDLMSSCRSHLPDSLKTCQVTGLGLNGDELQANPQLAGRVVHDLNRDPVLPFADRTFDAVICTVSIEYLIKPLEVLGEIARVSRPGGIFITTFSDRWFPGKQIEPWADLHRFERLGLVLDYYLKSGQFDNLHTASILGLPRPVTDRHITKTRISDPLFAVWGNIKW